MAVRCNKGWEIPDSLATPEDIFLNRRGLLKGIAAGAILAAGLSRASFAAVDADPGAALYPVKRNLRYRLDRELTDEAITSKYNNFYEFGSHKQIYKAAQKLVIRPWTIIIDGLVERPKTIAIDDLLRQMPLEERLYRHRCVEAWSMTIPWSGFPLKALIDFARPLGAAEYVVFETFKDADTAPGQRQVWYPWPYTEGLTMAEATNELAFMVTGAYGKPMAKQYGAPLRLAVPWKYGFKHIKSIVRMRFSDKRPNTFWQALAPKEYGFWANVNPAVPHPRWSQATERFLATGERVPTRLCNGYAEVVGDLYKNIEGEPLFK